MNQRVKKPNFFIIGAPKCGTTSLSRYLEGHQDIYMSPIKEPDYFATDLHRSIKTKEEYLRLFRKAKNHKAVGEASTTYLYSDLAIENILEFNPNAKFIVMTRDPVEMFHSLHSQNLINLNEDEEDPQKAWALQQERRKGNKIPETCPNPIFLQYKEVCMLGKQIKRVLNAIPEQNQIKIIRFEEFKNETKKVYEEVLKFLGVESDNREEFPVYGSNTELKFKSIKKIFVKLSDTSLIKKISSVFKKNLGVTYWPFMKKLNEWNKIKTTRSPLDKNFEKELKSYFQEDQKLLEKLIRKH